MLPYTVLLLVGLANAAPNNSNDTILVRQSPNMTAAVSFEPSDDKKFRDNVHFSYSNSSGEHSIVQTSLDAPCTPLAGGFASPLVIRSNETFNIAVEKDAPVIWYACAQHCNSGEVGAIYPITDDGKPIHLDADGNWSKFLSNARSAQNSFASLPKEGTPLGSGVGAQVIANSATRALLTKAAIGALAAGVALLIVV